MVKLREGWRGYLWQGRFASFMLEAFLATLEQDLDRILRRQKPGPRNAAELSMVSPEFRLQS
jgi:hypothetical protein